MQARIESGERNVSVKYLSGSSPSFVVAAVAKILKKKVVFITDSNKSAADRISDLENLIEPEKLASFVPDSKKLKIDESEPDSNYSYLTDALGVLGGEEGWIAAATPETFALPLPNPGDFEEAKKTIKVGDVINFDDFVKSLVYNGFERTDYVSRQGEIAVRGGITDVYPAGWQNPIRIEFFDDEIESIREFVPVSQRSIRELDEATFYSSFFKETSPDSTASLVDYLPDDCLIAIDSLDSVLSNFEDFSPPENFATIYFNSIGKKGVEVKCRPQTKYNSSVKNLIEDLINLNRYGTPIAICADGAIHLDRLREILNNAIEVRIEESPSEEKSLRKLRKSIVWSDSSPREGFVIEDYQFALITEHETFERQKARNRPTKAGKGISLAELRQLRPGGLVVHDDKGIARFEGFDRVQFGGAYQDCVRLTFDEGDTLYVHMNYIHKISKYSAVEGSAPKLSKLGTAEWKRKKARVKKKLKDIARDLIKIYARRKAEPGHAFAPDTMWQKEFEASFMYEDTPDQATSTSEIKSDMESEMPMDRLVCGDVGFGKTEVAVRAAFKAVQEGKQVAVLAPTTILAQQHEITFKDRLRKYPVLVDSISRFRPKRKQKEIVQDLKEGKIDILIGTHRMLSKDIKFKELGLLIIDEEQRFGVAAKEKLRKMRVSVDTLTLTATPIPRTLNFSLMGARDLSVIETPPRNRLPIQTEIMRWNLDSIREAIEAEIERDGQVFFVSDRVKDLEKIRMDLQMIMPRLKFGLAHGQMQTKELEKAMLDFVERKSDVLVCTKIIESGLDIPNANTMIINRAQNFGLAELYQLRGRTGRSARRAYCYLIVPPSGKLGSNAVRRLQAIEEFTDLGSGFRLAMRDLEIRGAGDLLGPDQSGFISDMGFELYQKILDEAVKELRMDEFQDLFTREEIVQKALFKNDEISITGTEDALIPGDYIEKDSDRFLYYKKLYEAQSPSELNDIVAEIKDKYGRPPKEFLELVFIVKVRIAALNTGFTRIELKSDRLILEFPPESDQEYYSIAFPIVAEFTQTLPDAQFKQNRKKLLLAKKLDSKDQAVDFLWRIKKSIEAGA